jgi:hypothetical protein
MIPFHFLKKRNGENILNFFFIIIFFAPAMIFASDFDQLLSSFSQYHPQSEEDKFFISLLSENRNGKNLDIYKMFQKIIKNVKNNEIVPYIYEEMIFFYKDDLKLVSLLEEKWLKEKKLNPPLKRWIDKKFRNIRFLMNEKRKVTHILDLLKKADPQYQKYIIGVFYKTFNNHPPGKYLPLLKPFQKPVISTQKVGIKKEQEWEQQFKLASSFWKKDQYANAIAAGELAFLLAKKENKKHIMAEIAYLVARIHENYQENDRALDWYLKVLPLSDLHKTNALKGIVLIYGAKKDWSGVLNYAKQSADWELKISGDPSFGFFWMARSYEKTKDLKNFEEMSKKIMSEYHSTYYGALSHFLLEKKTKSLIDLPTKKNLPVKIETILNHLTPYQLDKIDHIKMFLFLDKKDDAIYEIKRLPVDPGSYWQIYTKALLFYLSEEWLESVKVYLTLPRTFRNNLPYGSEKIIFPNKYLSTIELYCKKINLDVDLVLGLIRQESVFNPKALSQAGAQGIMQIKRSTALEEMKKLRVDYLHPEDQNYLSKYLHSHQMLFEVKPNLMIGIHHLDTLLGKYPNIAFSLAAYNAGPKPAERWRGKYPTDDLLYFIEIIPYKETRDYIKLIMRNYFYYKKYYHPEDTKYHYLEEIISHS